MARSEKVNIEGTDEALKGSVVEVVDLLSDNEELVESALKALAPEPIELKKDQSSDTEEDSSSPGEYWESESLLEDAFGGMSQAHDGQQCGSRPLSFFKFSSF